MALYIWATGVSYNPTYRGYNSIYNYSKGPPCKKKSNISSPPLGGVLPLEELILMDSKDRFIYYTDHVIGFVIGVPLKHITQKKQVNYYWDVLLVLSTWITSPL